MITDDTRTTLPASSRARSRWAWTALAVLVLGVAYTAAAWALSGRVPAGVEVAGVQIGHMTRDAAVERLERRLEQDATSPVPVKVGSAEAQIDPAAAGLEVDLAGTVDDLVGFSLDPRQVWRHLVGDSRVDPRTEVDDAALAAAVDDLAEQVRSDVVEGSIAFEDGQPVVTEAVEGRVLDTDAAVDVLAEDWFSGSRPLKLPADVTAPKVDTDAVNAAMDSFAVPATSGPLTVTVGDRQVQLDPAAFAPALSFEAVDGRLEPRVDGEVLKTAALGADGELVTAPTDATVRIENGAPVVVPGENGTTIDPAQLAEAALPALTAPERTVAVEPVVAEPERTTEEVQALGVREVVSQFATTHTADPGRTENLQIAARTVNGTLLLPGETFSLNGVLGQRTTAKGYNEAGAIMNGRLTTDVGGGVSQMATTLFNGMFFAGLEDVEHKPHSFYISRYPEGREATVNWPNVDLKFRNNTPYGVLIETWVGGGQVHTRFWSTKVWDEVRATKSERRNVKPPQTIRDGGPDCVTQSPNPGFDVTVTRQLIKGGAVQGTDTFRTRYIPQDQVICG